MQVYQLYIIAIFRGYSVIQESDSWNSDQGIVKLYTPSAFHSCSVNKLETDMEYVIGGSFRNKRLHASLCNLIQGWKEMTPDEKTSLLFQYLPNCACEVDVCFGKEQGGHTCETTEKMARSFNFNEPPYAKSCRRKHQYCHFNSTTESCAWHETHKYKTCMENIPWGNKVVMTKKTYSIKISHALYQNSKLYVIKCKLTSIVTHTDKMIFLRNR